MNQRSWNLAQEVVEKTTDDAERARMEALLASSELIGAPVTLVEAK